MTEVSIRELRNRGGEVVDRAMGGERLTITRDGRPVAELRGVARTPLSAEAVIEHWSRLPALDPAKLLRDVDAVVDSRL